jgi:hypothetical protein
MRAVKWFIINALFMALGVVVLWEIYPQFYTLFLFLMWALIVLAVLGAFSENVKIKARKKGRSVPKGVSQFYDLILVCLLAYHSWIWTAVFWLVQMGAESIIFEEED